MMEKDDFVYIEHILDSISKIEKYTGSINASEFVDNELIQDAVIRNFEIIGEATKNISNDFREKNSDIPWKKMAGMRDLLIHDYLGIDLYAVWETIKLDLPNLKSELLKIALRR
ncbi:MAG: DUF86 domain-containing protein [Prolixibacteraceae bacterium]|nr:DUF86 domain-containing protein [Prolixibacteraceae bacterium]